jgi:hypothetical protein
MTLLSICTAVCGAAPVAAPPTIVGATDQTATLLYALANQAGQALFRRPQGGWVTMIREFDFSTAAVGPQSCAIANTGPNGVAVISGLTGIGAVAPNAWVASGTGLPNNNVVLAVTSTTVTINKVATQTGAATVSFGQSDYALPADFQRSVDNTFWDRSRFWAMRGPQSPQQWQLYKSSVIGRATIQRRFRFRGANVIFGDSGVAGTPVLSIDPVPFDNGAQLVFEYVSNGWCQSPTGSLQNQWMADNDTGVLDEYLLQLGLLWRFLKRLGLAFGDELDEYEAEVDKAVAVDGASAILDMTPNDHLTLIGPWNLPETGYGNMSS